MLNVADDGGFGEREFQRQARAVAEELYDGMNDVLTERDEALCELSIAEDNASDARHRADVAEKKLAAKVVA